MQGLLESFKDSLPEPMHQAFLRNWEQYLKASQRNNFTFPHDTHFLHALWKVLAISDYACFVFEKHPEYPLHFYQTKLSHKEIELPLDNNCTDAELKEAVRRFRHRILTHILWEEINEGCTFQEHLFALSHLADVCIVRVVDHLYLKLSAQWGTPCDLQGQPQPFIVVALGKLGGKELNFSSDVDLMFTYPQEGHTQGGKLEHSNEEFFLRLAQQFVKTLEERTADGFVFRVDMRLRPYGQSGSLVMNFEALENYYQYYGREWERYALIKARVITGPRKARAQLKALLQPFIYRRYLDYGVFEALREMRELVASEVRRRSLEKHLKLGPGGIRQIEFLAQVFQLVRGGREPQFRHFALLTTIEQLAHSGYITQEAKVSLEKAYIFLRRVEHRLQMFHDEQTHQLPRNDCDLARLYYSMGYDSQAAFKQDLSFHQNNVVHYFNAIYAVPKPVDLQGNHIDSTSSLVWSTLEDPKTKEFLSRMGFRRPDAVLKKLLTFKNGKICQNLKKHARVRLDKVMPVLILMLAKKKASLKLITSMIRLMESIARRSAYLALLIERPQALAYLISIGESSEWIIETICVHPVLLDALLAPPTFEQISQPGFLKETLEQRIGWIAASDLDAQMECLREFKLACLLHLAIIDILEKEHQADIPNILGEVAEVILSKVYELCLCFMRKHYSIDLDIDDIKARIPFGIVAYGRLGAKEMSYSSDLDLVFLYDANPDEKVFGEQVPLTASDFSIRLAQRMIHMLSTHTVSGTLYEVDVRLRPGGRAGLLVSHLEAYKNYLYTQAWTWEHQALVKARCVVGDEPLIEAFEQLRFYVLKKHREPSHLREEIRAMRSKMQQLSVSSNLDVKKLAGGLADIDFIVQYVVLRFGGQYPELLESRSTKRLLFKLGELGLLGPEEVSSLSYAHLAYQHWLSLTTLKPNLELSSDPSLPHHQDAVITVWKALLVNGD